MSVYLLRNYGGFTASATVPVTLPDSTESSLIVQGIATAAGTTSDPSLYNEASTMTQAGSLALMQKSGISGSTRTGPSFFPNIVLSGVALTAFETNGVAQTTGTWNFAEVCVPFWNTWTGIGWLNGTTVGTNNGMVALWGSNGTLIANSAVAGVLTATASVFQNVAFTNPTTLPPGRYFAGVQLSGATDTIRHILAAYCANDTGMITGSVAGTFGTVPATITVPTTFTSAAGPIVQLYI